VGVGFSRVSIDYEALGHWMFDSDELAAALLGHAETGVALLSPIGPPVVKGTPSQLTPPIIVVRRTGGNCDYITDFPELMVRALDTSRPASMALQLECQRIIENAFASEVTLDDGTVVLIDGTQTVTSGHPMVYENVDVREVMAIYQIKMRRPVSVPA
jgi:hypothetical protein